jgi:Tfp pilus assembly protein PilF
MNSNPNKRTRAATYLALTIFIAVAYWQTPFHGFVEYDDTLYVTDSPITQAGITWAGIRWAMTDTSSGNWHPITRLAHMLDCELFGLNPAGHHVMSVLWHIAATLLLLAVSASMTGAFWPSAFAAALFGLHPLHVESVAWISERKDVMSAVCWFAAMGFYASYARKPSILRYAAVAIMLALGLMTKAMLVTLPCALLLLDIWPLRRFEDTEQEPRRSILAIPLRGAVLIAEKIPLFAIVAGHSVIMMQTQRIAMTPTSTMPFDQRLVNAVFAYFAYLGQTFWPAKLAVYYPYPLRDDSTVQAFILFAVLMAITFATLCSIRRAPYLAVGWLWFLGTLVPVIGLVQVGLQSRADRYTYIPSIGLFVAVAWLGAAAVKARPAMRKPIIAAALITVCVCTGLTMAQSRHWKDTFSLFKHAIAVTDDNLIAHINVANEYLLQGDHDQARHHFERAVEIGTRYDWKNTVARAHFGLGQIAEAEDDLRAAEGHYIDARVADGSFSGAHNNLAGVHMEMGRRAINAGNIEDGEELYEGALRETQLAIRHNPDNFGAALNAAFLLQHFGMQKNDMELLATADTLYRSALPHFDHLPSVHYNYSLVLERLGQINRAIKQAERAIELDPNYDEAKAALIQYQSRTMQRAQ